MYDESSGGPGPNPAAVALGRLGGKAGGAARAAKMTPQQRSEAARRAALRRWGRVELAPVTASPQGDVAGRIMVLAAAMFAADGYSSVSMRDLARRAGVGLPTLYSLFGGKAALYERAWLRSLETYTAELRDSVRGLAPGPDTIYAFCRTICRINADPARPRLLANHRLAPDDRTFAGIAETVFERQFGVLRESVVLLCGEADADMRTFAVYAISHGLIQLSPVARHSGRDLPTTLDPDAMAVRGLKIVFPEVNWGEIAGRGPRSQSLLT